MSFMRLAATAGGPQAATYKTAHSPATCLATSPCDGPINQIGGVSIATNSSHGCRSGVGNERTWFTVKLRMQAEYGTMRLMKKQMLVALGLLLLIPVVLRLGGLLFSLINPEIAAGHPNYARNYHLLNLVKLMMMWGSFAVVAIFWLLVFFLVIRSKERSPLWLLLAALGPFGFAILAMLNDKTPTDTDRYARFVQRLNWLVRAGYEVCSFVIIWLLAYQAMVLKRNLMILYQSARTGMSTAQILDLQNASSGMWAFAEGMEVMYLVILFYLLWPIMFNLVGRVAGVIVAPKTR